MRSTLLYLQFAPFDGDTFITDSLDREFHMTVFVFIPSDPMCNACATF
jgi:hypothetical protein